MSEDDVSTRATIASVSVATLAVVVALRFSGIPVRLSLGEPIRVRSGPLGSLGFSSGSPRSR